MALSKVPGNNIQDLDPQKATGATKAAKSVKSQASAAYAKAAPAKTIDEAANVKISPRAKEMSLARKIAEETPDINEAKVEKYKNLIARGDYKVDANNIVNGMAKEAILDKFATNKN